MKATKKTENLNGRPICPIKIGQSAVIAKNGKLYHTSPVIALHVCTPEYIHFETLNTHYHMSVYPSPFGAAAQIPLSLAA